MTPEEIVATARIVTPEEAAISREEMLLMRISLEAARLAGVPAHIVQFPGGAAAIVFADPDDKEAWKGLVTKTHAAALAGRLGPIDLNE